MCKYCYKKDDDNELINDLSSFGGSSKKRWIGKLYKDRYRKYLGISKKGMFLLESYESLDDDYPSYFVHIPINFCPLCGERMDLPKIGKLVKATINDSYYKETRTVIGRVVRENPNNENNQFGEYGENSPDGYLRFWVENGTDKYIEDIVSWEYVEENND